MTRRTDTPKDPKPEGPGYPHTCGRYPLLLVMECAYFYATGRPLSLPREAVADPELWDHLRSCPPCQRWYKNSLATCRDLTRKTRHKAAAGRPNGPGVRRLGAPIRAAADDGVFSLTQRQISPPRPGGPDLDALEAVLTWEQVGRGWKVQLAVQPPNKEKKALTQLDGCRVRLEYRPSEGPWHAVEMRLGLDPDELLVSLPMPWTGPNPSGKSARLRVVLLESPERGR